MTTFLVTGATGMVMQPLVALLLNRGHTIVALTRGVDPEKRIHDLFGQNDHISAVSGNIEEPLAGLSTEDQCRWFHRIDKIIHGAASVKFIETADGEIYRTNVGGTREIVNLAERLGIPEFHYLSTAYVAGDAEEFHEYNIGSARHHRNAYESSKATAEDIIRDYPGKTSIYRLSIVVGESQTGHTSSFNTGYYQFFTPFWWLRQILFKRWEEKKEECLTMGIEIDEQGRIQIPLFVPCSQIGPLNFVPIDWVTKTLENLVDISADRKTFHLTHPSPPIAKEVMQQSLENLGFQGIVCGGEQNQKQSSLVKSCQKAILKAIGPYLPYCTKDREVFGNKVIVETLGKNWNPPPKIDNEFVFRMIEFATRNNFEEARVEVYA